MHRHRRRALFVSLACCALAASVAQAAPPKRYLELLSPPYTVDGIYRSMTGPQSSRELRLIANQPARLVWITGFRAEMVGPDGEQPLSQEFMCHTNLDIDMAAHRMRLGWAKNMSRRLFTLSQGQQEVHFPEGFGIPLFTDELLQLTTQVLNLNPLAAPFEVRHRVTIELVFDSDLDEPLHALFLAGANGVVRLDGAGAAADTGHDGARGHGSDCSMGANAGSDSYHDAQGHELSGHWVVPPGRQVNQTRVTDMLNLPFDTTVHYIAVHLHPFAESLALEDLTTGKAIFTAHATAAQGKVGLADVEHLESAPGIPLYKNHEYQLTTIYDNPTSENQDSMASIFLYLYDREFHRPGELLPMLGARSRAGR